MPDLLLDSMSGWAAGCCIYIPHGLDVLWSGGRAAVSAPGSSQAARLNACPAPASLDRPRHRASHLERERRHGIGRGPTLRTGEPFSSGWFLQAGAQRDGPSAGPGMQGGSPPTERAVVGKEARDGQGRECRFEWTCDGRVSKRRTTRRERDAGAGTHSLRLRRTRSRGRRTHGPPFFLSSSPHKSPPSRSRCFVLMLDASAGGLCYDQAPAQGRRGVKPGG